MRFVLLILALMISAAPPVLAQGNGNGNADDQENEDREDNDGGQGVGLGNAGGQSIVGGEITSGIIPDVPGQTSADGTVRYTQDYARDAVNRGKAVSLGSLLPDLQERAGGEVIDAELLSVQGTLVYSVKVLRATGRVTREYYDAQSGRFIGSEG